MKPTLLKKLLGKLLALTGFGTKKVSAKTHDLIKEEMTFRKKEVSFYEKKLNQLNNQINDLNETISNLKILVLKGQLTLTSK